MGLRCFAAIGPAPSHRCGVPVGREPLCRYNIGLPGEMAEWSKALDSKSSIGGSRF